MCVQLIASLMELKDKYNVFKVTTTLKANEIQAHIITKQLTRRRERVCARVGVAELERGAKGIPLSLAPPNYLRLSRGGVFLIYRGFN